MGRCALAEAGKTIRCSLRPLAPGSSRRLDMACSLNRGIAPTVLILSHVPALEGNALVPFVMGCVMRFATSL
jgi:hypothetical protein